MPHKKYRLGITFGAFDPLHYGHIRLFERAKAQCRQLIVCVSTDGYIRKFKNREPFLHQEERLRVVALLPFVDVARYQSLTFGKKEALERWQPDVIFVGDDWTPTTFTGEGLGVPVVYLPHTEGISSTLLRQTDHEIILPPPNDGEGVGWS